jgi:hypothetical protein
MVTFSWTDPPRIIWQGWISQGQTWEPTEDWMNSLQLQAVYPRNPPADAPDPPDETARWMVVRVLKPGGWISEIAR